MALEGQLHTWAPVEVQAMFSFNMVFYNIQRGRYKGEGRRTQQQQPNEVSQNQRASPIRRARVDRCVEHVCVYVCVCVCVYNTWHQVCGVMWGV